MTTTALCIVCAQDIPDLGHLCRRCLGRLRRDLTDLIDLWADLDPAPVKGTGGAATGKPGSKPPLRLAVVDATDRRGEIHAQVCGWAAIVTEERQLHATIPDVPTAARLLLTHAEWLAEQPWSDEAAAEVRDAARIVKALTGNTPDPALGRCSDIDPHGERDRCGGPIRWADDGTLATVCGRCGGRWGTDDLAHIGRVVPLALWESLAIVAAMLDVPERTVYHWAQIGKIRRNHYGQVLHSEVLGMVNATRRDDSA